MFTLNATIEDRTISATSVDGHTFYATFTDTRTGHESHHEMGMGDLMAVYAAAMLGDLMAVYAAAMLGDDAASVRVAEAYHAANPDALRIIP